MKNAGAVAIAVVAGFIALKLVFGVAGGVIGLLLSLAWFAFKTLLFVGVAYWVLTMLAPDTARRWKERVGGAGSSL